MHPKIKIKEKFKLKTSSPRQKYKNTFYTLCRIFSAPLASRICQLAPIDISPEKVDGFQNLKRHLILPNLFKIVFENVFLVNFVFSLNFSFILFFLSEFCLLEITV